MTVCDNCKRNMSEEVTDGLFEDFCNEQSTNYLTEDGCFHYEERKETD